MSETIDIDAYLRRIGYTGPRAATLETLCAIHLRHPLAIPFENLDPLLKRPMHLDPPALERKMLHEGRGGWCYEQNLLLSHALRSLGFCVTGHAARVMYGAPEGVIRPRTHMLLRIDLAEVAYVADVGFGGLTLTTPLRLIPDIEQTTAHETFRLLKSDGDFVLQAHVQNTWKPLYSFDLQPQYLPDYELSNWYLANHPESPFVNDLMAARVAPDRRYGLFNNKLSIHYLHGNSEQRTLASVAELRDTLLNTFTIRVPDDPGLDAALARLIRERPALRLT
ncbi:MAG: nat [Gammaproteobacteria bacterium]|jgi:N-hydroxyarylamine O-acetyltransferase|nr:nat [Gammaproteobacteria bacterium]